MIQPIEGSAVPRAEVVVQGRRDRTGDRELIHSTRIDQSYGPISHQQP
jgi:hypothetical protein